MPAYTAICHKCDIQYEYIRKIADRANTPVCECGATTEKLIDACSIPFEYAESFISPIDGKPVHGREQYFAHMKEHNVVPRDRGVANDIKRQRQYKKEEDKKHIRSILEKKLESVDVKTIKESIKPTKYSGT